MWPLSQDYNEAIQDPASCFADTDLLGGQAVTNAMGVPLPRSGNFADVYEFRGINGQKWAVKCFTREVPGLQERYLEINRHLLQAKLPFTVDFKYLAQGIRIAGKWYPVLKMQWVDGFLLNEFVRNNLDKPGLMDALGQIWIRMGKRLREAGIAHADLQHGNVILVPGSRAAALAVKLIDYDGMYLPTLAGKKSGEVGHPAYQHPQRVKENIYSPEVDRLPLLAIASSLRALAVGGLLLWERYDNGDNMLFRQADLNNPGESALFKELWNMPDAALHDMVGYLALGLTGTIDQVPLLQEITLDGRQINPLTPAMEQKVNTVLGPGARVTRVPVSARPPRAPAPVPATADHLTASPPPAHTADPFRDLDEPIESPPPRRSLDIARKKSKFNIILIACLGGATLVTLGIILAIALMDRKVEKPMVARDPNKPLPANLPGVKQPNMGGVPKGPPKKIPNPNPPDPPNPNPPNPIPGLGEVAVERLPGVEIIRQQNIGDNVALSPNGRFVAYAARGRTLVVDLIGPKKWLDIPGNGSMEFSRDSTRIIVAAGKTAHIWDLPERKQLHALEHQGPVNCACFSPDGKTVLTASGLIHDDVPMDCAVRTWNAAGGKLIQRFDWKEGVPLGVLLAQDGNTLYVWDYNRRIFFLEPKTERKSQIGHRPGTYGPLQILPRGFQAILANFPQRNQVIVRDLERNQESVLFTSPTGPIRRITWSSRGDLAAYVTDNNPNRIEILDIAAKKHLGTLTGCEGEVVGLFLTSARLLTTSRDGSLRLWDLDRVRKGQAVVENPMDPPALGGGEILYRLNTQGNFQCGKAVLSADGKFAAFHAPHVGPVVMDLVSKKISFTIPRPNIFFARDMAFSPDGKYVVIADEDKTAHVWTVPGGEQKFALEHQTSIFALAYSPDGKNIASGSGGFKFLNGKIAKGEKGERLYEDCLVRLWNAADGNLIRQLDNQNRIVRDVAFSPDGKWIYSWDFESQVKQWDWKTGQLAKTYTVQVAYGSWKKLFPAERRVIFPSFLPSDRFLMWDLVQGREVRSLPTKMGDIGHWALSANGKMLAFTTKGAPHDIQLLDVPSGTRLPALRGHGGDLTTLAFSPNGKLLISASRDATVRLWKITR